MADSGNNFSGFLIAGVNSGSGKTTLALALMRALRRRGLRVAPFKCGPDYIDPSFHRRAADAESVNLDCRMTGKECVRQNWQEFAAPAQAAVVEGVMGLFDGVASGTLEGSSAEVALALGIPVILVVNAKGMAGSIAPLVSGFVNWNPELRIAGVIANSTGSARHAEILRNALDAANLPPLLGAFPRREEWTLPERHLGLVPEEENPVFDSWLDSIGEAAEELIDLDLLLELTRLPRPTAPERKCIAPFVRLAIALDRAFHFYYPDQLRRMREAGIELVPFSPLSDSALPENIQGVYLGGGFPELFAEQLERNESMKDSIREFSQRNGLIYAECGGYMYLMNALTDFAGKRYSMCGIIPCEAVMTPKLRSLGYRRAVPTGESPFGPGPFCGHEFHYSDAPETDTPLWSAFTAADKPAPTGNGCRIRRTFGSYIHLHFGKTPEAFNFFAKELSRALRS
mgnify:FL=1